jgi:hypothetical protein
MPQAPFEIYLARIPFRDCNDVRPCVILDWPRDGRVKVFPLSAAADLYDPKDDFPIDATGPCFAATGLKRTSYVKGARVFELGLETLSRRPMGRLTGELLEEFKGWSWYGPPGEPPP